MKIILTMLSKPDHISPFKFIKLNGTEYNTLNDLKKEIKKIGSLKDISFKIIDENDNYIYNYIKNNVYIINYIKE